MQLSFVPDKMSYTDRPRFTLQVPMSTYDVFSRTTFHSTISSHRRRCFDMVTRIELSSLHPNTICQTLTFLTLCCRWIATVMTTEIRSSESLSFLTRSKTDFYNPTNIPKIAQIGISCSGFT